MRSGQPGINSNELKRFNINHPKTINEQEKIGNFLCKIDDFIQKQDKKIVALHTVKKSYLQKLLIKSKDNNPKLRFKKFGKLWKSEKLKNIANIVGGWNSKN